MVALQAEKAEMRRCSSGFYNLMPPEVHNEAETEMAKVTPNKWVTWSHIPEGEWDQN